MCCKINKKTPYSVVCYCRTVFTSVLQMLLSAVSFVAAGASIITGGLVWFRKKNSLLLTLMSPSPSIQTTGEAQSMNVLPDIFAASEDRETASAGIFRNVLFSISARRQAESCKTCAGTRVNVHPFTSTAGNVCCVPPILTAAPCVPLKSHSEIVIVPLQSVRCMKSADPAHVRSVPPSGVEVIFFSSIPLQYLAPMPAEK